jgi:signal transduction histidine kinase
VLANLLGNAMKFTRVGGRIEVRVRRLGDDAVRIEVADTGVGIAPESLPHVFDRFWQASHARRAGAGLGLAIAKGIVEEHGGALDVESVRGHGSTFLLTLPIRPDDAHA